MKQRIANLVKRFKNLDSLEKKLFWSIAPLTSFVAFCSAIVNIFEKLNYLQIGISVVCGILPILIMFICYRKENYVSCYTFLSILLSCVIIPLMYVTNGGMFSGMVLICIAIIAFPCFNLDRKKRLLTTSVAIAVQVALMCAETIFPEIIIPIPDESIIRIDFIVCYLMAALSLMFGIGIVIDEFQDYTVSKSLINQYMDVRIQHEIIRDQEGNYLSDAPGKKYMTTILFADISNFTSITEGMTPEMAAEFLNTFLRIADKCVHDNNGILDKYMGDCVMCFWMDSEESGSGVIEACRTVVDIRTELHQKAEDIFNRFGCELDFAAGINYGPAVVGGIGSQNRKDFTVIGDAVNTAQRLQDIATRGKTFVSRAVVDIMGDNADFEMVGEKIRLKGKAQPVIIYSFNGFRKSMPAEQIPYSMRQNYVKTTSGYVFHVCGCRGSYSVSGDIYSEFGGETSCYIIKKGTYALVIDCGTGFYKARNILAECKTIDILLTHVHYDHILGLLDWSIFPKDAELRFFGDFDNWEGQDTLANLVRPPFWPVNLSRGTITSIIKKKPYVLSEDIRVRFYDSDHPNHCSIIMIELIDRLICIMADCENHQIMPPNLLSGCDLLVYDAMYENSDFPSHKGWGHSTWENGVALAQQVKPGLLLITHHDPKNSDSVLREHERQARALYPTTTFAREGDKISL